MRLLAIGVVLALLTPSASAADKDEEKAKEVTLAFLKAVKAKDIDAIMKTVDAPFVLDADGKAEVIAKIEELKDKMKVLLDTVNVDKLPTEVGTVLDLSDPAVRKKVASTEKGKKELELIEKVAGKSAFIVMMAVNGKDKDGILVRIKDGQAKVVGVP
jgi:hypothetical protein